jgi:hypothetical protein
MPRSRFASQVWISPFSGTAILDESIAREVAIAFQLEVHGTLFLLFYDTSWEVEE